MTYRVRSGKYEVCGNCGAHLDHGEKCDCAEREKKEAVQTVRNGAGKALHISLHI